MQTITLNIPESLLINRAISFDELRRESQFVLAAHLYQNGYLSSGAAAGMCEMNRTDFILAMGRKGHPVADLDAQELDREVKNA